MPSKAKENKGLEKREPDNKSKRRIQPEDLRDIDHDIRPFEERSRSDLYQLAKKLNIEGRSKKDKDELIDAIRRS